MDNKQGQKHQYPVHVSVLVPVPDFTLTLRSYPKQPEFARDCRRR